jgi:hypothetical protein
MTSMLITWLVTGWICVGILTVMYTSKLTVDWGEQPAVIPTPRAYRESLPVVEPAVDDYDGSITQRVVRGRRWTRKAVTDAWNGARAYVGHHRPEWIAIHRWNDNKPVRRHRRGKLFGMCWDTAEVPSIMVGV